MFEVSDVEGSDADVRVSRNRNQGISTREERVTIRMPEKMIAQATIRATIGSRMSTPVACTRMVEPGPAPSIISPMIERPETLVPSLVTVTSQLWRATSSTGRKNPRPR